MINLPGNIRIKHGWKKNKKRKQEEEHNKNNNNDEWVLIISHLSQEEKCKNNDYLKRQQQRRHRHVRVVSHCFKLLDSDDDNERHSVESEVNSWIEEEEKD